MMIILFPEGIFEVFIQNYSSEKKMAQLQLILQPRLLQK